MKIFSRIGILPRLIVIALLWGIGQSSIGLPLASENNDPKSLVFIRVEQLSFSVLRVTLRLNPSLPAYKSYNIGVFAGGVALMVNCNNYGHYNGCYFPDVTTAAPTTFLLVGEFGDDWQANKYLIMVALAALSPAEMERKGFGPFVTKDTAGVSYPFKSVATLTFFPFGRLTPV
jgi:hypothetical protein